jgi:hypothetical protein
LTEVATDALAAALPLGDTTVVDPPNGCTTKMITSAITITTIAKIATIAALDPPSLGVLAMAYLLEIIDNSGST